MLIFLIIGIIINRFWFLYILFLVFLGGILVLFIYVIFLVFNEIFKFLIKLIIIYIFIFLLRIVLILLIDFNNYLDIFNYEINNIEFIIYIKENINLVYKLYNFLINWLICLIINYLFFVLIVIVKIIRFFYGLICNFN